MDAPPIVSNIKRTAHSDCRHGDTTPRWRQIPLASLALAPLCRFCQVPVRSVRKATMCHSRPPCRAQAHEKSYNGLSAALLSPAPAKLPVVVDLGLESIHASFNARGLVCAGNHSCASALQAQPHALNCTSSRSHLAHVCVSTATFAPSFNQPGKRVTPFHSTPRVVHQDLCGCAACHSWH